MEVRCGAEKMRRLRTATTGNTALAMIVALLLPAAARAAAPTDLAIHATATSFRVGTEGSYHVSVSNGGDLDTDAPVRVTSTLPAGLSFLSGGGGGWSCSGSGRSVECSAVCPILTLSVSVGDAAFPTVTNVATVTYANDTDTSNNTARRPTTVRR